MMRNFNNNSQSGFSLPEVLIVLVILIVVATFALLSTDDSRTHFQRQNISTQFKNYLERARYDSVKRRANSGEESRVRIHNANSFSLIADFNQDGSLNVANERSTVNFTQNNGGSITGNFNFPNEGYIEILFDRLGRVTAQEVVLTNNTVTTVTPITPIPSFTFCNRNCGSGGNQNNSNSNSTHSTVISISAMGTVAMSPGGVTVTTPQNTSVSNINSNAGINNRAIPTTNTY